MKSYYIHALQAFDEATSGIYEQSGYPYGPFLPYVFEQYNIAPHKIFFMGQDTYYWLPLDLYLSMVRTKDYAGYLRKNSKVVTGERLLLPREKKDSEGQEGMNWGSGFWGFVQKAYIYYRTGVFPASLSTRDYDTRKLISEIGYSEAFSIELPRSLENEGNWATIDCESYNRIFEAAKQLSDAKMLIEAYNPDAIVLLNWSDYIECFENLENEQIITIEKSILNVYSFKGYRTKLFWMRHPTNFHRLGYSDEQMAELLVRALRQYV